jgi:valyl-tRNA synthetase
VTVPAPELPQFYDPHAAFARYAAAWEASGVNSPRADAPGEPYCIVIPPPNVTGSLHMGHALNNTLQDVLIRYKRMDGFNAVWIPGMDHAGIATQWIVEKQLRAKGIDRRDLGREKFLSCVWEWKEESGGAIVNQLKRLGVSCDWSRERFTMDEGLSAAVRDNFVKLVEEGLIYRATRLINWDPVGMTALSDLEVETEENVQGELWSFAYPLSDGSGEIVVATTRPETMLGDTAVAVHPEDPRYQHLIGQTVRHPILGREIPIVGDAILVDPSFGSGAVKVTPAHDFNDHAVGKRHSLPLITIFTLDGKINAEGGPYAGLDRFEARTRIKADIEGMGLARGSRLNVMTLPRSQRSGAVVEPMVSTQWFVRMKPLAAPALAAVQHDFTRFHPKQWENTYFSWLRDIQDWCISRQLWWGHRIPAWHCAACGETTVSRVDVTACGKCGSASVVQDEDVLDTWFSSALWPFSTLGWPARTPELAKWYPNAVLITGFDIIFFWVARMMVAGLHNMGSVPFRDVYIHGLVRDEHGDKMSKTKGNVVDPLVAIEKHGTDAFRMTLTSLAGLGRDLAWSDKSVEIWTRFQNKVWQSFRFLRMHISEKPAPAVLGPMDRWILARAGVAVANVRTALDSYRFNDAAAELHRFVWYELCDWYLEFSKAALYGEDEGEKAGARYALWTVYSAVARLLHPFMPFLAEELWQNLPGSEGSVVRAPFPRADEFPAADDTLAEVALLQEAIVAVRRVRAEKELSPRIPLQLVSSGLGALGRYHRVLDDLVKVTVVAGEKPEACATVVVNGVEGWIPLAGVLDLDKERERLDGQIAKVRKSVDFLRGLLGNEGFVAKAKPELLAGRRAELEADESRLATLEAALAALG